jgi:hypothetical protein
MLEAAGAAGVGRAFARVGELVRDGERCPELRRDPREPSKVLRHHADNLERRPVHPDRAVEHLGIAREVPGPAPMAQDDDGRVRLVDEGVILLARETLGLRVGRHLTFDRE